MTYLFIPQKDNLQIQSQELARREAYYQKLEAAQSDLPQLQKEALDLKNKMLQQSTQLPAKLNNEQILVDLYVTAKQQGVLPQSLTFDSVENKANYQEINMTFKCEGTPSSVLNLLQTLQYGSSLQTALRGIDLTSQKGVMKAELKLAAYAAQGSDLTPGDKPVFMNSPFGVDNPAQMFTP